jgi:hypothetical protein
MMAKPKLMFAGFEGKDRSQIAVDVKIGNKLYGGYIPLIRGGN